MRLLPLLLLLPACVIQSERFPRPRDLDPTWLVDRPRLLAIQAEPPDVLPGQTTRLRALFVDPDNTLDVVLWIGCSDDETTNFGCAFDPSALGPDATPQELADAGVFGIEPGLPPVLTLPDDYLDGLDPRLSERGRPYTATAIGLPAADDQAEDDLDFNALRVGFKRVMVSTREPPNQNPGIDGWRIQGEPLPHDTTVLVAAGGTYEIDVDLSDDAIESYTYLNIDDEREDRVEEPFAEWYASGGVIERDSTIHPFLFSRWRAPRAPDVQGSWWIVVKDRRGGLTWSEQRWRTF